MTNDELEERRLDALMDGIGDALEKCLPPTHGFMLMIVEARAGGAVQYLSNLEDTGVIRLMQDFIARRDKERS